MMFNKVGYRYVTVTCRNCSNTLFFDAALMGDVSLDSALTPAVALYHGDVSSALTPAMARAGGDDTGG